MPDAIWISAAETSADIYGADLLRQLETCAPHLQFIGVGGPEMRRRGLQAFIKAEELSLMGFTEVVSSIPRVLALYRLAEQKLKAYSPQCVVLLDAPDFHFRVAKMAHKLGIPVYYYISPQVWAWRKGRIKFMRRYVRKVLCILPFEEEFLSGNDLDVVFVGHPLLQQIDFGSLERLDQGNAVTILPGSRTKEVSSLLPEFAAASDRIAAKHPELAFQVVCSSSIPESLLREHWTSHRPLNIVPFEQRYTHIKTSRFVLTASGTASLECALIGTPAIVAYKVSWLSYLIARLVVDVPFISMPNIILQKEIFPEYIQAQAKAEAFAEQALQWLDDPERLRSIRNELFSLRQKLGKKNAAQTSARIILQGVASARREHISSGGED
jgi:lipid-A-disaccharide synthase